MEFKTFSVPRTWYTNELNGAARFRSNEDEFALIVALVVVEAAEAEDMLAPLLFTALYIDDYKWNG